MVSQENLLDINIILHTKDGSKIGNAIIIGKEKYNWKIKTDYGNELLLNTEELLTFFNVAWCYNDKEFDGYTTKEAQDLFSSSHKHRVNYEKK